MSIIATAAAGMSISSLLETIATAITIVKEIPGAAKALVSVKKGILNLEKKDVDILDEESPLGRLVKSEEEEIKRLMKEFSEIMKREDLDDYTKDMHRKRIAERLCRLLGLLEKLLEKYLDDYAEIKSTFCDYAKNA